MFKREVDIRGGGVEISSPPLDIHFQIVFDTDPEPNTGVVTAYNLSDDTTNRFKRGQNIIINAGYKGDKGTIIAGNLDEVRSEWEVTRGTGNERRLTLEIGDATDRWLASKINKTYKPGTNASQIITDMLGIFGLEVGAINIPNDITYDNGRSFSTSLQSAIRQVANDCQAKFHISNGAIFILPRDAGNRVAFVLSPSSGLIESPERIDSEDGELWRVTSLLNHRIRADSIIKVESRNISGFFRVVSGEHICNDQDFETRLEVAAV